MKQVYIFCPGNYISGGPEALHQLRYYMELEGIDAWIVYTDCIDGGTCSSTRYNQYFPTSKKFLAEEDYVEDKSHLIIMPESTSRRLLHYHKAKIAIWWLSVLFYDSYHSSLDRYTFNNHIQMEFCKFKCLVRDARNAMVSFYLYHCRHVKNYCASQFAFDYVRNDLNQEAVMLVEPISKEFLEAGGVFAANQAEMERSKEILYNPVKSSKLLDTLIQRGNFHYHPIRGYNTNELVDLYRNHMLYIDFGDFPGPERIPKEAAYNGCNILVGKINAAENDFDVAILDTYKMYDPTIEEIELKIEQMLAEYESEFNDFNGFRYKIDGLESGFKKAIRTYFVDYLNE